MSTTFGTILTTYIRPWYNKRIIQNDMGFHYCFITAKIAFISKSLSAVQVYDFHIFPAIYSPLHGFIWNQHSDQLLIGLLAHLVEHCTGIAEVMGSNPVQAWIFFGPSFHYCLRSLSYPRLNPQFKYMTFIYSQPFIQNELAIPVDRNCQSHRITSRQNRSISFQQTHMTHSTRLY